MRWYECRNKPPWASLALGQRPRVNSSVITNVAISSTGRWLAAGTHAGHIVICDRTAGYSCRTAESKSGELNDLRFSPNERFLAVANSNLELLALDNHTKSFFLRTDKRNYGTVRFDNTGTELLTINSQSEIELIDIESRATNSGYRPKNEACDDPPVVETVEI